MHNPNFLHRLSSESFSPFFNLQGCRYSTLVQALSVMSDETGKISEEQCLAQVKSVLLGIPEVSQVVKIFDDDYLLRFIRGRKYNPVQTISTVQKYISVRKGHPEVFLNLFPSQVAIDRKLFGILRHEDELSRSTLIINLGDWSPDDYSIDGLFRQGVLLMESVLHSNTNAQKYGMHIVMNMKNLSLKQCRHITPFVVQKLVKIFWGAFPMQYKEAHIVNSPWCFTILMSMVRPLLPKKLNQRLKLHTANDLQQFHQRFSPNILPLNLQGRITRDEDCFSTIHYQEHLKHMEPFYQSLQKWIH